MDFNKLIFTVITFVASMEYNPALSSTYYYDWYSFSQSCDDFPDRYCCINRYRNFYDKEAHDYCFVECTEDTFKCETSGNCIPMFARCDGRAKHCEDNSDHLNCDCDPLTQRPCADGGCIALSKWCDGKNGDCYDYSDEADCVCGPDEFACEGGGCIPKSKRCDGVNDCDFDLDEKYCPPCSEDQFQCDNSACIDKQYVCDISRESNKLYNTPGSLYFHYFLSDYLDARRRSYESFSHCSDDSDEKYCLWTDIFRKDKVPYTPFYCQARRARQYKDYVDVRKVCDGKRDCNNGADERRCGGCRASDFQCNYGWIKCIPRRKECNGIQDCLDHSDERHCTCNSKDHFQCKMGWIKCIPKSKRCDKNKDCEDYSDESDCDYHKYMNYSTLPCLGRRCRSGQCYARSWQDRTCDGQAHCPDRSDEENCTCSKRQFACRSGGCISLSWRCDKRLDCDDGSDEEGCEVDIVVAESGYDLDIDNNTVVDEIRDNNSSDTSSTVTCKEDSDFTIKICVKGKCITGTCAEIVAKGKKYKKKLCRKKKQKCCLTCNS